ncbi:gas vesicle protein GvpF [Trichothermofontia sp.]
MLTSPMSYGLYLYGIFPLPGPKGLALQGLDQQMVHLATVDGFAILYSEAQQERYLASRRNLLGHAKVLEDAMQAGYHNLLPLQFGLIVETLEDVSRQLTGPYQTALQQLLDRLEGRREVGVKVFWNENQELQALMAENTALREQRDRLEGKTLSMDEVVMIGQAIEHAMQSRQAEIIDTFRTTLNPLALKVIENNPMTDAMIYNAAYLIRWEEEPHFSQQVEALDQEFDDRLRIRYNNFTAPFNFARLEDLSAC